MKVLKFTTWLGANDEALYSAIFVSRRLSLFLDWRQFIKLRLLKKELCRLIDSVSDDVCVFPFHSELLCHCLSLALWRSRSWYARMLDLGAVCSVGAKCCLESTLCLVAAGTSSGEVHSGLRAVGSMGADELAALYQLYCR
eukprot:Gregarina_sp_Poly_1__11308@NODE_944_length_5611_cov_11_583514_g669_i0_p4_GENE_NODE_944_length_5611_cov_11_583514_g669_i0NODE_944_length_5611_cov_11_583514_g669_i0_p4_ORF_typecomplete_len141_score20_89_NODE_944_length_5611_cov_11_583514_g669_i047635185